MAYRKLEKPKPRPKRTLQETATPSTIYIKNGATMKYSIPCWYLIAEPPVRAHHHSRPHHDHVGWPSPTHPDHICQAWDFAHACCSFDSKKRKCDKCKHFLDMGLLAPIHLTKEGYQYPKMNVAPLFDLEEGKTAKDLIKVSGNIRSDKDWIVDVTLHAFIEKDDDSHLTQRHEFMYTLFMKSPTDLGGGYDVLSEGKIIVLPGPVYQE